VLNVNLFVKKVTKCKQSGTLTYIQNNILIAKRTEAKACSGYCPISFFLETITELQNKNVFEK
jgi:hypothetical protein